MRRCFAQAAIPNWRSVGARRAAAARWFVLRPICRTATVVTAAAPSCCLSRLALSGRTKARCVKQCLRRSIGCMNRWRSRLRAGRERRISVLPGARQHVARRAICCAGSSRSAVRSGRADLVHHGHARGGLSGGGAVRRERPAARPPRAGRGAADRGEAALRAAARAVVVPASPGGRLRWCGTIQDGEATLFGTPLLPRVIYSACFCKDLTQTVKLILSCRQQCGGIIWIVDCLVGEHILVHRLAVHDFQSHLGNLRA